jgi:hypothetical protein
MSYLRMFFVVLLALHNCYAQIDYHKKMVRIIVKDSITGQYITDADIHIVMNRSNLRYSFVNKKNGVYEYNDVCSTTFRIEAYKKGYLHCTKEYTLDDRKDISLNLNKLEAQYYWLSGRVLIDNVGLGDVTISIAHSVDSSAIHRVKTNSDGSFQIAIPKNLERDTIKLIFKKPDFVEKTHLCTLPLSIKQGIPFSIGTDIKLNERENSIRSNFRNAELYNAIMYELQHKEPQKEQFVMSDVNNLEVLDLEGSKLASLKDIDWRKFPKLNTIDVSGTPLKNFKGIAEIKELQDIKAINMEELKSLDGLDKLPERNPKIRFRAEQKIIRKFQEEVKLLKNIKFEKI